MKQLLAIKFPGANGTPQEIQVSGIPQGGLSGDGGKFIVFGLTLFLVACILLSFGFILYGGLNWIMSQGDKTKLESARKTILYAVSGLLIAILSFFMVNFLGSAFGVDLFKFSL